MKKFACEAFASSSVFNCYVAERLRPNGDLRREVGGGFNFKEGVEWWECYGARNVNWTTHR